MDSDAQRLAEMLGRLRHTAVANAGCGRVTIATVEALAWIAAGVDNCNDLGVAMGTPGNPQATASTSRIVSALRGRGRWDAGKWIEAPFQLVETRKHPHRKGMLLELTQEGRDLLQREAGPRYQ